MRLLDDARMYGRFAMGLNRFLRSGITLEQAREVIRYNLEHREDHFLAVLKKGVFGYEGSPYLPLLNWAGCEYGDIEKSVQQQGLEEALTELRHAGVYFSFEEFKGRKTVVRGSREFPMQPQAFDNPYLKASYMGESGGSTGVGTRTPQDFDHMQERLALQRLTRHILGTENLPMASWRAPLPSSVAIHQILNGAVLGNPVRKWFMPIMGKDLRPSLKYSLAQNYLLNMVRLHGIKVPRPESVPLDRADIVVRWMDEMIRTEGGCFVSGGMSLSLRIAVAAREMGVDLTGAYLSGGGEPPTETKARAVESTGAKLLCSYHFTEVGAVGHACMNPACINDNHVMEDHLAVLQFPRRVPGTEIEVQALTYTTLLPSAPKILLNVEIDDYGVIEERSCGCEWEKLGLRKHVSGIRSFRKLTGEGMTLVGSDMERILEQVLPERFGGNATDYQLLEEEDENGFTQRSVIVSPRVQLSNEQDVVETIFNELGKGDAAADLARAFMSHGQSLGVKRMEPVWTNRGKLMPLHLVKHGQAVSSQARSIISE